MAFGLQLIALLTKLLNDYLLTRYTVDGSDDGVVEVPLNAAVVQVLVKTVFEALSSQDLAERVGPVLYILEVQGPAFGRGADGELDGIPELVQRPIK